MSVRTRIALSIAAALALGAAPAQAGQVGAGPAPSPLADLDPVVTSTPAGTRVSLSPQTRLLDTTVTYIAINRVTGERLVPDADGMLPAPLSDGLWTVGATGLGPNGPIAVGQAQLEVSGGRIVSSVQDDGQHGLPLVWTARGASLSIEPAAGAELGDVYQWQMLRADDMQVVARQAVTAPGRSLDSTRAHFVNLPDGRYVFHSEAYRGGLLTHAGDVVVLVTGGIATPA